MQAARLVHVLVLEPKPLLCAQSPQYLILGSRDRSLTRVAHLSQVVPRVHLQGSVPLLPWLLHPFALNLGQNGQLTISRTKIQPDEVLEDKGASS